MEPGPARSRTKPCRGDSHEFGNTPDLRQFRDLKTEVPIQWATRKTSPYAEADHDCLEDVEPANPDGKIP